MVFLFQILEHIMKFLNPADRREAAIVSKRFSEAAHNVSKIILNLNYCRLDDNCMPLNLFLKSWKEYKQIILGGDIEFGVSCEQFWNKFGEFVQELTFDFSPFLTTEILMSILRSMKNLKKLHISCRKEYFLNGSRIVDEHNREDLTRALKNLIVLSINGTNLTNVQFSNLMSLVPNLESLNIFFCHEVENSTPEEHYLTCGDILETIKLCPRLKEINLDDFGYRILNERDLLTQLATTPSFKLKNFNFPLVEAHSDALVDFLKFHTTITTVGVGSGIRASCENLKLIIQHLPYLKELNVCDAVGQLDGLSFISELDNLEKLRLANYTNSFNFEEGSHIVKRIKARPKLKKLEINSEDKICADCLVNLTMSLKSLTVLKLPHNSIDDAGVQIVFANLTLLRKLCLAGSFFVNQVVQLS